MLNSLSTWFTPFRPHPYMPFLLAGLLLLTGTGCESEAEKTARAADRKEQLAWREQQNKRLQEQQDQHAALEKSLQADITALKEKTDSLEKANKELEAKLAAGKAELLDAMWTSAVDKSAFEEFKAAQRVPAIRVPGVPVPPVLDGKIDALYEQHATPMHFTPIQSNEPDRKGKPSPHKAYILISGEHLYFVMHVDAPGAMANHSHKDRDATLWEEECIDMFISPKNNGAYYQIITNSAGNLYDADSGNTGWNPKLELKVGVEQGKAWILELKIPLKELGVEPKAIPKIWGFNVTYFLPKLHEMGRDVDLAWSPTGQDTPHVPEKFGQLWMAPAGRPEDGKK